MFAAKDEDHGTLYCTPCLCSNREKEGAEERKEARESPSHEREKKINERRRRKKARRKRPYNARTEKKKMSTDAVLLFLRSLNG